jgi:hypothetical protein
LNTASLLSVSDISKPSDVLLFFPESTKEKISFGDEHPMREKVSKTDMDKAIIFLIFIASAS